MGLFAGRPGHARSAATLTPLARAGDPGPAGPTAQLQVGLVLAMLGSYLVVLFVRPLREFYLLEVPDAPTWVAVGGAIAVAAVVLHVGPKLIPWWRVGDEQQSLPTRE